MSEKFDKICIEEIPGLEELNKACSSIEILCTNLIIHLSGLEEEQEYTTLSNVLADLKSKNGPPQ